MVRGKLMRWRIGLNRLRRLGAGVSMCRHMIAGIASSVALRRRIDVGVGPLDGTALDRVDSAKRGLKVGVMYGTTVESVGNVVDHRENVVEMIGRAVYRR